MANDYYTRQGSYTKGTLARGDVVKSDFDALVTAWDTGQTNIKRALKLPDEGSPQTDWEITENATNRASKAIGFDSSGDLELQTGVGSWEGTWATTTAYELRDVVVDGAAGASTDNLYVCIVAHTSGTWATDLSASKWELMVNVSEARDWARKTDGIVDSTDYSSKSWAIGGIGVTDTASKGAAKEWSIETSGTVDGTSYSSKEYAQGTQASTGGSAKDFAQKTDGGVSGSTSDHSAKSWAVGGTGITNTSGKGAAKEWSITAEDSTVDGTSYSSLHYAAKASASATSASTAQTAAETAETNAETAQAAAETAQAAAETAQTAAETAETNAETAETNAETAETNSETAQAAAETAQAAAETAQAAAETAETNAETAETNAETAETNAETAEANAETAQAAAETAQTAAETAETNASASSTSASSSATSAAASATSAAASYDSFDDRYLGAKSSAPTVDNDGNSLTDGCLYFDDTIPALRVYDLSGTSWQTITADTDVKVSVSSNDTTPGYLNGKLVEGANITFTENNDGGNETLLIAATDNSAAMALALGG